MKVTKVCFPKASADFPVSGAYALGQSWDLLRAEPDTAAVNRMRNLPFPSTDPVNGSRSPLTRLWL